MVYDIYSFESSTCLIYNIYGFKVLFNKYEIYYIYLICANLVCSQTKTPPQTDNHPPQYLRQNSSYDTQKYSNPGAIDLNVFEQHDSENFGSHVSIKKEELYEKKYEKYERYEREKMEGKIDKFEDDRCSSGEFSLLKTLAG